MINECVKCHTRWVTKGKSHYEASLDKCPICEDPRLDVEIILSNEQTFKRALDMACAELARAIPGAVIDQILVGNFLREAVQQLKEDNIELIKKNWNK